MSDVFSLLYTMGQVANSCLVPFTLWYVANLTLTVQPRWGWAALGCCAVLGAIVQNYGMAWIIGQPKASENRVLFAQLTFCIHVALLIMLLLCAFSSAFSRAFHQKAGAVFKPYLVSRSCECIRFCLVCFLSEQILAYANLQYCHLPHRNCLNFATVPSQPWESILLMIWFTVCICFVSVMAEKALLACDLQAAAVQEPLLQNGGTLSSSQQPAMTATTSLL